MSSIKTMTVKDVPAAVFIPALALHFKKKWEDGKLTVPEWVDQIKTSNAKEMSPEDADWYFTRAAALARQVYVRGGRGVGNFTTVFGGSKARGTKSNKFQKAASGVIRTILQQLKELDIVDVKKDAKGRWITKNGQHELDTIASQIVVAEFSL